MGAVVVITGAMAAGKSTVAQLPAEALPRAAHVRGDVFRRMVVSGRAEVRPDDAEAEAQLRLRYRLSAMVADEYAAHGWTAVVQDVILGDHLAEYVDAVRTRPRYVVLLAPSADALRAREEQRAKTGYGDAWTVEDLDRGLREGTPRLGLWLDTTEQTPDETVRTILDRLDDARVD
ncbi:AAA family ATPase [Actinosynnema sp. NPDC091369]